MLNLLTLGRLLWSDHYWSSARGDLVGRRSPVTSKACYYIVSRDHLAEIGYEDGMSREQVEEIVAMDPEMLHGERAVVLYAVVVPLTLGLTPKFPEE